MGQSTIYSTDGKTADKPSVWREFLELLRASFHRSGPEKNEWLMPFEPGPSSFRRETPVERKVIKPRRRRRPF
jgi:hypothetical protein